MSPFGVPKYHLNGYMPPVSTACYRLALFAHNSIVMGAFHFAIIEQSKGIARTFHPTQSPLFGTVAERHLTSKRFKPFQASQAVEKHASLYFGSVYLPNQQGIWWRQPSTPEMGLDFLLKGDTMNNGLKFSALAFAALPG